MNIKILINDEEVVCSNEIEIQKEILNTSSVILNNVYPKTWEENHDYVSKFYLPLDYSICKIYVNDELVFAGVVQNSGEISLNPREPKYASLEILDFKCLLSEGKTLDFVIDNKTITEAISMVINAISDYGFVLGNLEIENANTIIGAYSTLDKTAYDVFQYLAEVSQSLWTTRMLDDKTVAIDFYDPLYLPKAITLDYTEQFWDKYGVLGINYNFSTRDYRNKQTMLSDQVYANINSTENIIASGYQTTFTTEQKIGRIISVKLDDVVQSFATTNDKNLGYTADFYYEPGKNEFTCDKAVALGDKITITYLPLVKGREIIYNTDEITRVTHQLGRNGTITRYEGRNDVLSSSELRAVGRSYIRYKGKPEVTLTLETATDLYEIGQAVTFNINLDYLQGEYLVKKKNIQIIHPDDGFAKIFYTYELSNTYNCETEINYFDNQRRKQSGNISEGEYIAKNIDIENTVTINLTKYIIEELKGNVLECILDAAFTK